MIEVLSGKEAISSSEEGVQGSSTSSVGVVGTVAACKISLVNCSVSISWNFQPPSINLRKLFAIPICYLWKLVWK